MEEENLLILVDKFHQGDNQALLSLIESKYIISTIDALYHSKMNYKLSTASHVLERDEIISDVYILLSKRLMKFKASTPQQVTTFITKAVRGYIMDLIKERYVSNESPCEQIYNDTEAYNEYEEFESDTLNRFDSLTIHLEKIKTEFPMFTDYYINEMTYEQIADKYNYETRAGAWQAVSKEHKQIKEYLINVLSEDDLREICKQYGPFLR